MIIAAICASQQAGRLDSMTNPLGNISTTLYDCEGRVSATVNPLGSRATNVYDAAGQFLASENPLGERTTTVYDVGGRSVASISPLGNSGSPSQEFVDTLTAHFHGDAAPQPSITP